MNWVCGKILWVIFTSDHGELLGDHGGFGKGVAHSQSCRVPFIIEPAWFTPDHWRGNECQTPIMLEDIMPTVLNIAGIDVPEHVDGTNILDVVDQRQPGRMVDGCWGRGELADQHGLLMAAIAMYITHGGIEHFFDESVDPLDAHNLAGTAEVAADQQRLKSELIARRAAAGHPSVLDGVWQSQGGGDALQGEERADNLGLHTWKFQKDVLH